MKSFCINLFVAAILLSVHLSAQQKVNSQELLNGLNNYENKINHHVNNGGYILLSSGNYVCGEFGYNNLLYVIREDTLYTLDIGSMIETVIGEITGINTGQFITTIGYSFNSGEMYLGTTSIGISELYSLDLNTAAASFIGIVGQPGLNALDVDCSGNVYSIDIADDMLWEINPNTGAGTQIGSLGFDANFDAHLDFDLGQSTLYLVAFNNATFSSQLRTVNLSNGTTKLISDLGGIPITVFAFEGDCGPGRASNPQPPDSSINISVTLDAISWENPPDAISNEIRWGTDPDSLDLVLSGGLYDNYTISETLQSAQSYYWRVDEVGPNGTSQGKIWMFTTEDDPTNITENYSKLLEFSLEQNYPNPFNPSTKIKFTIPNNVIASAVPDGRQGTKQSALTTLKVYDVLGNEISTLINEEKPAGEYEVEFSATGGGTSLTSGIYFYKLQAGEYIETKKMILLK